MPAITLRFSTQHAQRIIAAVGATRKIESPSAADVKLHVIAELQQLVRTSELRAATELLAQATDVDIT